LAIATIVAVGLHAALANAADGRGWTVSEVHGDVRALAAGVSQPALQPGQILVEGSGVMTGSSGRLTLMHAQTRITMQENSQMELPVGDAASTRTIIIQSGGTLLYDVEKRSTPHFEVKTPYLAAVVKGTSFAVNVGESGSNVRVSTGAVEVEALHSGEVSLVRSGLTAVVSATPGSRMSIMPSEKVPTPGTGPDKRKTETDNATPDAHGEKGKASQGPADESSTRRQNEKAAGAVVQTIGATSVNIPEVSGGLLGDGNSDATDHGYGAGGKNAVDADGGSHGKGSGNAYASGKGHGKRHGKDHGKGHGKDHGS
jgi:hypothetical protein